MPSIFQSIDSNLLHTVNGGEDATYKAGVNYAGLKLKNCLDGTKNIGNAHDRSWAEQACFDNFVNVDMRDALKTVGVIPTSKALCVGVAQKPTTSKTSNGCFAAGTWVQTPRGARPIETLAFGDEVVSVVGGKRRIARIVEARRATVPAVLRIHFTNGTSVDATPEHRFFDAAGGLWEARDLAALADLADHDGAIIRAVGIEQLASDWSHAVYNLALDTGGTFFANQLPVESLASELCSFRSRFVASQRPLAVSVAGR